MTQREEKALEVAQGYHDLGMIEDAWVELESLETRSRSSLPALNMETMLLIKEQRWEEALELARKMCKRAPKQPNGYLHTAFCLHEMGKTQEALEFLVSGPESLRSEAVYFYNQSCYQAKLGKIEEADLLLRKAIKMDDKFKKMAKQDPDLIELWPLI